jgi:transposase
MAPCNTTEFTPSKRGRILALRKEGYTYQQIASKMNNCSASAAFKTVQRDKNHHTRKSLPRSGRPPAISDRTHRTILRDLRTHRFQPYKQIAAGIHGVNERQVQDIAHAAGYHWRVVRRKPFLSARAVKKCLEWAKENEERDWSTILWTDEASIETGERPTAWRVTCMAGEEYLPENIMPTFKSGRKSIMVWACVAHGVKGPIWRLDLVPETMIEGGKKRGGGLNAKKYIEQILRGPLKDFCMTLEVDKGHQFLVVEDGAPSHTSRAAGAERKELGIHNLTHPPSSPDLNPIEPLWLVLKNCVADIPGLSNSLDALWAAVQKVWSGITEEDMYIISRS